MGILSYYGDEGTDSPITSYVQHILSPDTLPIL